ncbi:MAG TPA: WXG100 family type VII secretion target [Jatrophihabitans sp.]|jgi:hypothetical protein|nr:WXG100 family type VII secretion target [Jatrophihabitans sp.]
MASGEYTVRPEALRGAVGNVGGVIVSAMNVVRDLEALLIAPTSFAAIGSTVAGQNTAMQGQQVSSLQLLLKLLQDVNALVRRCADDYDSADQQVAVSYGGSSPTSAGSGLWSSQAGPQLAGHAITDSAGAPGEPHSVGNVLDYLGRTGLSSLGSTGVPDHAGGFADWLDASPDNQARAGVVGVYAGAVRTLDDVPGGVQRGDIVVVDAVALRDPVIGVVGGNSQLLNHGPVTPDFASGADVRVYRPFAASAAGS